MNAQETFEQRAKAIAEKIEKITTEEKLALKDQVDDINKQVELNKLSQEQADKMKADIAIVQAKKIETRVALEEAKLTELVKEKVNENVKISTTEIKKTNNDSIDDYIISIKMPKNKSKNHKARKDIRTTTQFVLAAGVNNVITNGSAKNSDFRYWGSHFYEWGVTANTRVFKNDNLLHIKYGFSVMYNNLRPTDNRKFEVTGNQTNLVLDPINQQDSRLKSVYLVVPVHFEFDFSGNKTKNGKSYFKSQKGFRLGIGGYTGINLKSKQYLEYDENGYENCQVTKGDFNTSNFIYGVSSYIGYKDTSLYMKYDLNPLFTSNVVKQNNISLGIRFDFN
jgi:hypothetical protein